MFAVCAIAVLCLASVSRSAPLACNDLVEPLSQIEPNDYEGRWIIVAGSVKVIQAHQFPRISDSTTVDFYNSTYTLSNRFDEQCHSYSQKVSIGPSFKVQIGHRVNFTGTFFKTSCPDCGVLQWNVDAPLYKSEELYLFSKRRQVNEKEMEEFIAQVECLQMPKHFVMDPTKELCSVQTTRAT